MSESTLRRITLVLAAIVVAWLLVTLTRRGGAVGSGGELAQALHRLQQDTATAFTITAAGGAPIEIAQSDDAWTVNGMPADSDAVNRLRNAVSGAAVGDLVSTSPRNHERLGVGADSAWSLVIHTGTRADTLLVGKAAQSTGYSYVRLPGNDQTWEVSGDLRSAVVHTIPDWRDKVMARVDTTTVARIEIARGDTTFALVKDGAGWKLGSGDAADSTTMHAVLTGLSRFAATTPRAGHASVRRREPPPRDRDLDRRRHPRGPRVRRPGLHVARPAGRRRDPLQRPELRHRPARSRAGGRHETRRVVRRPAHDRSMR